ncbi:LysR family transcriptional regulator [Alteromonas oceanisediminis]|uniref:LysR family transcriptional regulator n=1 Tax=Alteromonas oceanisediminis TaxID=2836180 RepID=UPI001BDB5D32|nr:LysR family transcriptional regulator [Alteromonas oceanisediminis]MBT0588040.1 LysR family transcriptional regulator [Alteromonas oceanisediminis]
MDKLRTLEMFLATCDAGSFVAAAKKCRSDPSTVSKAITRLERQLALTLFQRSTRALKVTPSGLKYEQTARRLLNDLSACEEELKQLNDSPTGTLRISSAVCYGHLYLRPILRTFCQHYPDIKLDIEINDLYTDIIESHIDVSIRTGFVSDSRLVARCLTPMDFLICASPDYLAKHGTPQSPKDFEQHNWISFRIKQSQKRQPIFLPNSTGGYIPYNLISTHMTDDGETMAHLCEDGFGFAQLPHFLAKEGLAKGTLVSPYPSFRAPQPEGGVFAIYPKREFLPQKVKLLVDFIIEYLAKQQESTHATWAESLPN